MATPATIHVQLWHGGCRLYCHPLATGLSRPNARPVDIQLSSANSSNIPTFDLATQELSLCRQLFVHDYICSKINQFETRRVRSIRSTVDSESQKTKSVNFLALARDFQRQPCQQQRVQQAHTQTWSRACMNLSNTLCNLQKEKNSRDHILSFPPVKYLKHKRYSQ